MCRAEQHPVGGRQETASGFVVDLTECLDLLSVDAQYLASVDEHEPPVAVPRQRGDGSICEPALALASDEPLRGSDDPAHGL